MTSHPSPHDTYTSPLASRNASPEMLRIWSPRHKFNTWRRIWLAIAEAQHEVTKDASGRAPSVSEGAQGGPAPLPDGRGSSEPLVTQEQVDELRAVIERGITDAELERAGELERELRHDVMAHVHCLGEQCPKAKPIIHLGCTSQDVVCNADLLIIEQAQGLILDKIARAIFAIGENAHRHRATPTLGFTHYQTAQPVTVGRRLAQWAYELVICEIRTRCLCDTPTYRGLRGATGTQAAFVKLAEGAGRKPSRLDAVLDLIDKWCPTAGSKYQYQQTLKRVVWGLHRKKQLELVFQKDIQASDLLKESGVAKHVSYSSGQVYASHISSFLNNYKHQLALICDSGVPSNCAIQADDWVLVEDRFLSGFDKAPNAYVLTTQTYPRVIDTFVLADLASIASVLHKIATDIRLLSNRKELDEPFGKNQIGSSAMPYKRNPMKCERICGLTRFVMNLVGNAYDTAATQWLERTLDDSSNRRLSLPEAFLALDGALDLMHQVASGLVVNEAMVRKNLMAELPFLATENILMEAVKAGGDRQDLHEKIRVHAQAAGQRVKQEGLDNDLIERLRADPAFAGVHHLLTPEALLDPMQYVGRSVEQTERFIAEVIEPMRERYKDELAALGESDRGV